MFLINTRKNTDDGRYFSSSDGLSWFENGQKPISVKQQNVFQACKGQNILFLIHGFNNPLQDIFQEYKLINKQLNRFAQSTYDVIIGFIWPGGVSEFDYFRAKVNTGEAGKRLHHWLQKLSVISNAVDVIGHSMAAQVGKMALRESGDIKIRNIYSMGAAINTNQSYGSDDFKSVVQACEQLFVFFTSNDRILKYAYRLIEWHNPVGYTGPNLGLLNGDAAHKVRLVDCSNIIADHTGYIRSPEVFQFIGNSLQEEYENAQLRGLEPLC
ncbi:MAG TPA: DUF726 domain-containing protein [Balneolaceae bacterium]|nr:DUF726 domain-containing protein [Balneolaceae bacterium]